MAETVRLDVLNPCTDPDIPYEVADATLPARISAALVLAAPHYESDKTALCTITADAAR